MPVQILLSQAGAPAGSAGRSRTDFVTGVPVQAQAIGGPYAAYLWTFVSKAEDVVLGARSAAAFGSGTSATTSVTPIDQGGEYLIQVAVDSGSGLGATPDDVARVLFYAGVVGGDASHGILNSDPAELPQRMPAFRETIEDNTADPIDVGGNVEGWAKPWRRLKAVVDRIYQGKAWAWARVQQTGGGAAAVSSFNVALVTRTGVGTAHVQFLRSLGTSNYAVVPAARGDAGSVFALNESPTGFDVQRSDIGGSLADLDWTFEVKKQ